MDGITSILPDEEMRALGFTDRDEGSWYLCTGVDRSTTLNIRISKLTGAFSEHVLDEFFGQPEYYGKMREPYRTNVRMNIDGEIARLNNAGLHVHVDHRLYGWVDV